MTERLPHILRSDALDNRDRILTAARALFASEGLGVPLREVARKAGVGPATLYRRFPTKQALIAETFRDEMVACHVLVDEGLAEPDPWRGFCHVIERLCELHAQSRGFSKVFVTAYADQTELAEDRGQALHSISELAGRAKETGRLRQDFVLDDLILMLMANRGIHADSPAAQVAASRRFAALVIQAFQAAPGRAPLPPVPRLVPAAVAGV
ncbi:TetR/AcrR family transcriptional regulator [Streptomyces sp. NPDC050560]|uniref:TetR/AcrR family transcriptional regulator n=1 Tax=Streptomyces sp. NPDC050560 TaxID=3365630 RepID=UPI0037B36D54